MNAMRFDNEQFPVLSNTIDWGIVQSKFSLIQQVEDESLISNVSIIPHIGDRYVIIQLENGKWELPGGTLEPGEHYMDGLKRELMEEAGAQLLDYHIFGQFYCESTADKPYRPHIPHPHFIRILGFGEVKIVGRPSNPADGEQVMSVAAAEIEEAVRRFERIDRHDIAEMYKLAHVIRTSRAGISPANI